MKSNFIVVGFPHYIRGETIVDTINEMTFEKIDLSDYVELVKAKPLAKESNGKFQNILRKLNEKTETNQLKPEVDKLIKALEESKN